MSRRGFYIPITRSGKSILASIGTQCLQRTTAHDVIATMIGMIIWTCWILFLIFVVIGLGMSLIDDLSRM